MIQYNKEILDIKKDNPLFKLENKYGKIFTYNYNDIKDYNDSTNYLFTNKKMNKIKEEKESIIIGGIENSNKDKTSVNKIITDIFNVSVSSINDIFNTGVDNINYIVTGKENNVVAEENNNIVTEEENNMILEKKNIINTNTIKKEVVSKITNSQRMRKIRFAIYIFIVLFIVNLVSSNVIYKWKLNGLIYPLLILIICVNVYMISKNILNKLNSNISKGKGKLLYSIKKTINTVVKTIRSFPDIIPNIPNLPKPKVNKNPFKAVRNDIRKLLIKTKIDTDKWEIEVNVPSLEFDFINPIAAFCCAWEQFKKLLIKVKEKVIDPFVKICIKIYTPIKKAVLWAKENIIDPIVNTVIKIYRALKKFFNKVADIFIAVLDKFTWIPFLGKEIRKLVDRYRLQKLRDKYKNKKINNTMERYSKDDGYDKKASEAAMKKSTKDTQALIDAELGLLDTRDTMERMRRFNNLSREEQEEILKTMSDKQRKILKIGQKLLNKSQIELEEYCKEKIKKLKILKTDKLRFDNILLNASKHVDHYPEYSSKNIDTKGGNNKFNQKYKEFNNLKYLDNLNNDINITRQNLNNYSNNYKNIFDIENTNIVGFIRTFHILKDRYIDEYNRKDTVLFRLKTIKLRNKYKYYKKKCKDEPIEGIRNNINNCIENYFKNMKNDILKDTKEVIISSKRLLKFYILMKEKNYDINNFNKIINNKNYNTNDFSKIINNKNYNINNKNLKILKENNLKYSKLIGGWSWINPINWFKAAWNAALKGIKSLFNKIKKAFEDLVKAIKNIPKILKRIIKSIGKIVNIPQIFKKIISGIKYVINWIKDEAPAFFKKILKILENVGIIIKWFVTTVLKRGIKIIMAIIEFFIKLIERLVEKIILPSWASKDNPILKLPGVLEKIVKVIGLPFKKFFETIGNTIKKVLSAIPIKWITTIGNVIKDIAVGFYRGVKAVFDTILDAVRGAIHAARTILNFFGYDIYEKVPGLKRFVFPPRPNDAERRIAKAKQKEAFRKKFILHLDMFTKQINILIDRRRKFKLAKNLEGYKNITKLIKEKAAARDIFKRNGYRQLKAMRV